VKLGTYNRKNLARVTPVQTTYCHFYVDPVPVKELPTKRVYQSPFISDPELRSSPENLYVDTVAWARGGTDKPRVVAIDDPGRHDMSRYRRVTYGYQVDTNPSPSRSIVETNPGPRRSTVDTDPRPRRSFWRGLNCCKNTNVQD
jgi:hypothetical protein